MKSNAAALETALEARCSSSVPRLYYSYARTNILTAESLATSFNTTSDNTGWSESGGGTLTYGDTDQKKYGDGAAKFVCSAQGDKVVCTIPAPSVASYQGKTLTFSVRVYCADAESVRVNIADNVATTNGSAGNTSAAAWRLYQVAHAVDAAATSLVCEVEYRGTNTPTLWIDGAKLEEASTASNWSGRFFDVDDLKVGGVTINATEIAQARLRGTIEWGQLADNSAPAPLMAFTSHLKFTFEDDGTIISQWTKQGTGIHMRIGQTSASAYADCTPAFHGIVWDWTKVAGTDSTYNVECYGLEKLWQEYDCGPDGVDGPRRWGQWLQTDTTVAEQFVYKLKHAVNGTANPYHLYKATYDNVDVNQMNALVCRWDFSTTTDTAYYLHALWPLSAGKTLVSQFYEGKNYTDWIDYVESLTAITNGMPASRTGHGGDTLTATDGPWAAVVDGSSAWDNLANAVGVAYYGFRYDENGQIVLKNLPGTRVVSAASRATSESDATKTGQIREFERLDDVYRCNDPCVEFTKYGVASTTAGVVPTQYSHISTAQIIYTPPASTTTYSIMQVTANHARQPFCPASDFGVVNISAFSTVTIDAYPHAIDTWWRANGGDGNGTVTCSGGAVVLTAPANGDTAFIESPAALGATWAAVVSFQVGTTTDTMWVFVRNAQGAHANVDTHYKIGVAVDGGNLYMLRSDSSGTVDYSQVISSGGPGDTSPGWTTTVTAIGAVVANTRYYVALINDGTNYHCKVMDSNRVLNTNRARENESAVADTLAGDDYLCVGKYANNYGGLSSAVIASSRVYDKAKEGPFRFYLINSSERFGPFVGGDGWGGFNAMAAATAINYQPLPQSSVLQLYCGGDPGSAALYQDFYLYGSAYCPEVRTVKVADAAQTGLDGATTVAASRTAYGYKGLKQGTWTNPFLWSDAQAQTLTNAMAKLNLEPRAVIRFATKGNPKWEPWDLFHLTYFSEYSASHWEVIGVEHTINLDERGGGYETRITARRWTA